MAGPPRDDKPGVTRAGPLTFQPTPKRVSARVGDLTVADSERALLLWEEGAVLPVYLFPRDDVVPGSLSPSAHPPTGTHHALATFFDLPTAGRRAANAAWSYRAGGRLDEYIAFDWEAIDSWWEEDEQVLAHPRDPYHRVDIRRSGRHVVVAVDGTTLADSSRPSLLFETDLPTRYYLPTADVATGLLAASDTRTQCAYKGEASYWSAWVGGRTIDDIAWTYAEPLPDSREISGLVCFLNEIVDLTVDGRRLDRPRTPWSGGFRTNTRGGGSGSGQGTQG